jgi:glycerol-3-phosphate O-acyltransferase
MAHGADSTPAAVALVTHLAYRVMNEINRVTAVTPGALVATALLDARQARNQPRRPRRHLRRLAAPLRGFGARFTPSLTSPHEPDTRSRRIASRSAGRCSRKRGTSRFAYPGREDPKRGDGREREAHRSDAIYLVPDGARLSLDLSKNIVVHFFIARALVAAAVLAPRTERRGTDGMPLQAVQERVQALSRLFKHEFLFRAETSFEENFAATLAGMVDAGELVHRDGVVGLGTGEGALNVTLYAEIVRSFLESYRVAARGLSLLLRGPLAQKDVAKRSIAMGERMFLNEEIVRCEAVSRPVIDNALSAFIDEGYLVRTDGKLALAESYATAGAVKTIESRIALYLPRPS